MLRTGDVVNGKYRVTGVIGRGGMSVVYKATDLATGKTLAIKDVDRSKQSDNQVFEARLTDEGQLLKRLSNTHLPKIYDIIENTNNFMLVMDYVEGESLDKVIARTGPQPEKYIYNWGKQICDVFTYLHSQNPPIIYRDMKPANIILQPNGKIMMIDFGTARTHKSSAAITTDTILLGTDGFAAPEQFGTGQSDARTDIYCLGATLYNMVTGHSPSEEPRGIRPLKYWDPAMANSPLNAIIQKCTQRMPLDRYQTAAELKADLDIAASGHFKIDRKGQIVQTGWQKQMLKTTGALEGLSGLLKRSPKESEQSNTGAPAAEPANGKKPDSSPATKEVAPKAKSSEWQPVKLVQTSQTKAPPRKDQTEPLPTDEAPQAPELPDDGDIWRKLMIIAAIAAVALLVLSVIFTAVGVSGLGTVFLIFAVAALALAGIGIYMFMKGRGESDATR